MVLHDPQIQAQRPVVDVGQVQPHVGTDLTYQPDYALGYAPAGGRSLMRHLTDQGATLDELAQAGLVSQRERDDGTTYYRDFFRDRLVVPIRDVMTRRLAPAPGRRAWQANSATWALSQHALSLDPWKAACCASP